MSMVYRTPPMVKKACPSMQLTSDSRSGPHAIGDRCAPGARRAEQCATLEGMLNRFAIALMFAPWAAHAAAPLELESNQGMVVTSQHLASDVGPAILRQGGNAVDAAVAVGYALAVTHPCCGNLGGGGFMTIHLADGENTFINFREKAPLAARADMFLDARGNSISDASLNGYLAAGVPGTVMGLEAARQRYGTLPRSTLMAEAIRLAENGFVLSRGDVDELEVGTPEFRKHSNVAAVFLNHDAPYRPGERLVQANLAKTPRAISEGGPQAFYQGSIAAAGGF